MFHKTEFNFLKCDNTRHLVKCKIKRSPGISVSLSNWWQLGAHIHGVAKGGDLFSHRTTKVVVPRVGGWGWVFQLTRRELDEDGRVLGGGRAAWQWTL